MTEANTCLSTTDGVAFLVGRLPSGNVAGPNVGSVSDLGALLASDQAHRETAKGHPHGPGG
ncbi:hypothetical protein M513_12255 [Trichuris suis]|uniref:Uncharacterized protein n=1 Tax=Trichuris suis TaxID=68888 RepID=A0A085LPF4_9BILA|nr:hypothetical protein M513_12255 [Trichuris suis]